MIDELANSGAMPALAATMKFAAGRQKILAHNIANIETPNFRPMDVSPRHFQKVLGDAVDSRRARGSLRGELPIEGSRQISVDARGRMRLTPRTPEGNVLFHDRNNRDLERSMQDLVENAGAFRVASNLMRSRVSLLRTAISERV